MSALLMISTFYFLSPYFQSMTSAYRSVQELTGVENIYFCQKRSVSEVFGEG